MKKIIFQEKERIIFIVGREVVLFWQLKRFNELFLLRANNFKYRYPSEYKVFDVPSNGNGNRILAGKSASPPRVPSLVKRACLFSIGRIRAPWERERSRWQLSVSCTHVALSLRITLPPPRIVTRPNKNHHFPQFIPSRLFYIIVSLFNFFWNWIRNNN